MHSRRLLWSALQFLGTPFFLAAFRPRVFATANVPRRGGVLIVSNHQSYLDPLLLGYGLRRELAFMARRSLFRNKWFGTLIRKLNAFPVTRSGPDAGAFREAVNRLRNGWALVVFPEGTRTRDGSIGPFRPGVSLIARRASVPVVPAVVEGPYRAWPRRGGMRLERLSVAFGKPIMPAEYEHLNREALTKRLRETMLDMHKRLRERAMRARMPG